VLSVCSKNDEVSTGKESVDEEKVDEQVDRELDVALETHQSWAEQVELSDAAKD